MTTDAQFQFEDVPKIVGGVRPNYFWYIWCWK